MKRSQNNAKMMINLYLILEIVLGGILIYFYNDIITAEVSGSITDSIFHYFLELYTGIIIYTSISNLILYFILNRKSKYIIGFFSGFLAMLIPIVIFIPLSSNPAFVLIGYFILPLVMVSIGFKIPLWNEYRKMKA
jgi:hypothetical protein